MGSSASLIFYIIAFFLSALFVYQGNRKRAWRFKISLGLRRLVINPSLLSGAAIPILVAGFRQNVGTDFKSYVVEYNAATQTGSYLEPSFNIIANLSSNLTGSPTLMFVIFSALTVIPVMLAINKCSSIKKEYRWMFWMLFLFIMFPQTLNLLRQGVSVALSFYLIVSVIESRALLRFSHILVFLLAVSFHSSAWIVGALCLIAYLMNNRSKRAMLLYVVTSSAVILAAFSILPWLLDIFGGAWSGYLDKEIVSRSILPRSALIAFILMVCWKFRNALRISNSYTALLWSGLLVSIGGLSVAYFERIGYYATLLLPLLVLVMIAQAVRKEQRTVVNLCVAMLALIYFVGIYYVMGSSDIFPYSIIEQGGA